MTKAPQGHLNEGLVPPTSRLLIISLFLPTRSDSTRWFYSISDSYCQGMVNTVISPGKAEGLRRGVLFNLNKHNLWIWVYQLG